MKPITLIAGSVFLAAVYIALFPDWNSNPYIAFCEGASFGILIGVSHVGTGIMRTLLLAVLLGLLNLLLTLLAVFIVVIPGLIGAWFELGPRLELVMNFSWLAFLGALLTCLAIDGVVKPDYFNLKTYFLVALACMMSGLVFLLEFGYEISIQKGAWWILFSLGLAASTKWNSTTGERSETGFPPPRE